MHDELLGVMEKWFEDRVTIDIENNSTDTTVNTIEDTIVRSRTKMLTYINQYRNLPFMQPEAFKLPILFMGFDELIYIKSTREVLGSSKQEFEQFMLGGSNTINGICSSTQLDDTYFDVYKIVKTYCILRGYAEFVNPTTRPKDKLYRIKTLRTEKARNDALDSGWEEVLPTLFMYTEFNSEVVTSPEYKIAPKGYIDNKIRYHAKTPVCYTHNVIHEALEAFRDAPETFRKILATFSKHTDTVTKIDEDFLT